MIIVWNRECDWISVQGSIKKSMSMSLRFVIYRIQLYHNLRHHVTLQVS